MHKAWEDWLSTLKAISWAILRAMTMASACTLRTEPYSQTLALSEDNQWPYWKLNPINLNIAFGGDYRSVSAKEKKEYFDPFLSIFWWFDPFPSFWKQKNKSCVTLFENLQANAFCFPCWSCCHSIPRGENIALEGIGIHRSNILCSNSTTLVVIVSTSSATIVIIHWTLTTKFEGIWSLRESKSKS